MGYMYAENLERIDRVDSDGYIYAENLERLGKINPDGYIYGENLNYIGRIDRDGYIFLSNMKRIGRIQRDGYVYNESLNRVGKLDEDIVDYIFKDSNIPNQFDTTNHNQKFAHNIRFQGFNAFLGAILSAIVAAMLVHFGIGMAIIGFCVTFTLLGCIVDGIKIHITDIIACLFFIVVFVCL